MNRADWLGMCGGERVKSIFRHSPVSSWNLRRPVSGSSHGTQQVWSY